MPRATNVTQKSRISDYLQVACCPIIKTDVRLQKIDGMFEEQLKVQRLARNGVLYTRIRD